MDNAQLQPDFPIPTPQLMRLSVASADPDKFLRRGRESFDKVIGAFTLAGGEPTQSAKQFLEWGCGCGRMTRHALGYGLDVRGVDINPDAIEWNNDNLKNGAFATCGIEPPLPYADETFDFIYAGSVITHLGIELQFKWMREMRRILKPHGLLLLTFAGTFHFRNYYSRDELTVRALDAHPFLEVGKRDDGLNTYGIAQTVGTLDSLLPGFERRLHIQAHDVLGAQDTAVFEKLAVDAASMVVLLSEARFVTERTDVLVSDSGPVASVDGGIPDQLHIVSVPSGQGIASLNVRPPFEVVDSYALS